VPLPERRGAIPVLRQDPRPRRALRRDHRRVTGEAAGELTDRAETDRVVVPAGQQRRPRRRAQRGDMEPVVPQPRFGHPRVVRGADRPAERARVAEPGIVDQHQQDIRGSLRRLGVPDQVPVGLRPRQRPVAHPPERRPAYRQLCPVRIVHRLPASRSNHRRPGWPSPALMTSRMSSATAPLPSAPPPR